MAKLDQDIIDTIRALAGQGFKSKMIAARIGKSRSMVAGVCFRHKIKLQGRKIATPVYRPEQEDLSNDNEPLPTRDFPNKVRYFKANPTQCHYPLWGDEFDIPFSKRFFCGAPVLEGTSYCADCLNIIYRPVSSSEVEP